MRTFPLLAAALVSVAAAGPAPRATTGSAQAATSTVGPWTHAQLTVDGPSGPLSMHALVAGDPAAERVVLLHGFPDFSYGWRDVLPALAERHRVFAPDLRGYGGTDRPDDGYGIQSIAADVVAFIRAANRADGLSEDTPVHLIGHDWGAATGWWVAMQAPALLRSWTAVSVPHPLTWAEILAADAPQRRKASYQRRFATPGVAGIAAGLSRGALARAFRGDLEHPEAFTDAHLDVYAQVFDRRTDWAPPLRYYQRMFTDRAENTAAAEAAGPVRVPTLVLWGAHDDFLFARNADRSCARVQSRCDVHVFDGAGHFVQWDDPAGLVEAWRGFVGG